MQLTTYTKNEALAAIRRRAVELFGGCTLLQTVGDWLDPETGNVASEPGYSLFILVPDKWMDNSEQLAHAIKTLLQQQAVFITASQVQGGLL
jgi:hypothetical protein